MKKSWESKTIVFNGVVAAIVAFCNAVGIEIPNGAAEAILTLGNILLRFLTKEPIAIK